MFWFSNVITPSGIIQYSIVPIQCHPHVHTYIQILSIPSPATFPQVWSWRQQLAVDWLPCSFSWFLGGLHLIGKFQWDQGPSVFVWVCVSMYLIKNKGHYWISWIQTCRVTYIHSFTEDLSSKMHCERNKISTKQWWARLSKKEKEGMDNLGLSNSHEEQGEFNGLMKEFKLYHECSGLIGQVCLFGSENLKI